MFHFGGAGRGFLRLFQHTSRTHQQKPCIKLANVGLSRGVRLSGALQLWLELESNC